MLKKSAGVALATAALVVLTQGTASAAATSPPAYDGLGDLSFRDTIAGRVGVAVCDQSNVYNTVTVAQAQSSSATDSYETVYTGSCQFFDFAAGFSPTRLRTCLRIVPYPDLYCGDWVALP